MLLDLRMFESVQQGNGLIWRPNWSLGACAGVRYVRVIAETTSKFIAGSSVNADLISQLQGSGCHYIPVLFIPLTTFRHRNQSLKEGRHSYLNTCLADPKAKAVILRLSYSTGGISETITSVSYIS